MNLYIKFLILIFKRLLFKKSQDITEKCVSNFRVSVFDLDLNFHMNNGKFFSVMDLGRFDMLMRTGHFYKLFKNGYYPVVLSESIVFKKPLNHFDKYELHTHLESWDSNFFYLTQKFYKKDKIAASAQVRACFKKRGVKGLIPVKDLFEFIGSEHIEKTLSPLAQQQVNLDNQLLPRKSNKT